MLFYLALPILSFSLINLVYWPIQDYFVRQELILTSIPSIYSTLFLLLLVVILTLFQEKIREMSKAVLSGLMLVSLGLAIFSYNNFYYMHRDFFYMPVIYEINDSAFIQGSSIKISGIRFFDSNQERGRVIIGDQDLIIKDWRDYGIIAQLPVPNAFGEQELQIIRSDQKESNKVKVEIKDPASLGN